MQRSGHLSLLTWWPDSLENCLVPSLAGCYRDLGLCTVRGEGKLKVLVSFSLSHWRLYNLEVKIMSFAVGMV